MQSCSIQIAPCDRDADASPSVTSPVVSPILQALRVDASGEFLFVSNRVTHGDLHGSISVFRLDPNTGLPSGPPTVSSTLGR